MNILQIRNRVGEINYTNLGALSPQSAITEMLEVQSNNKRTKQDKTYHLMLSFRTGEQPSSEILQAVENEMCEALGFAEHQRLSVVHTDTDNLHIHIAINKVSPNKPYRVHAPYNDYYTIQKVCAKLEQKYGLEVDNHKIKKTRAQNKAGDIEHHTGIETLLGWMERNHIDEEIRQVNSWQELHEVLADNGLLLKKRGNGFIFEAIKEGIQVKASSLGREFSKSNLEKRFGEFEIFDLDDLNNNTNDYLTNSKEYIANKQDNTRLPKSDLNNTNTDEQTHKTGRSYETHNKQEQSAINDIHTSKKQQTTTKNYIKKPISNQLDTSEYWAKYLEEQKNVKEQKELTIRQLKQLKHQVITEIWQEFKQQSSRNKALTYQVTAEKVQQINRKYRQMLSKAYNIYPKQSWFSWLQHKAWNGNDQALKILRARFTNKKTNEYKNRNLITGKNPKVIIRYSFIDRNNNKPDGLTKQGTAIYSNTNVIVREQEFQIVVDNKSTSNQSKLAELENININDLVTSNNSNKAEDQNSFNNLNSNYGHISSSSNNYNTETMQNILDLAYAKFGNHIEIHGDTHFVKQLTQLSKHYKYNFVIGEDFTKNHTDIENNKKQNSQKDFVETSDQVITTGQLIYIKDNQQTQVNYQNIAQILTKYSNTAEVKHDLSDKGITVMNIQELLNQADELKNKLDKLRPLPSLTVNSIKNKLALDWIYHSNAIEGNTLDVYETKAILEDGITIGGKSMREHLEAINHKDAINLIEKMISKTEEINATNIKKIHYAVLKGIDEENAGFYRRNMVIVVGANFVPTNHIKIDREMNNLDDWYKSKIAQKLHPIERATQLHTKFVTIHPFIDGNGRTARLIMNFELMKYGYPPAIIKKEERQNYYRSLDVTHKIGNYDEFTKLVALRVIDNLNLYLGVITGVKQESVSNQQTSINTEPNNFAENKHAQVKQEKITGISSETTISNSNQKLLDELNDFSIKPFVIKQDNLNKAVTKLKTKFGITEQSPANSSVQTQSQASANSDINVNEQTQTTTEIANIEKTQEPINKQPQKSQDSSKEFQSANSKQFVPSSTAVNAINTNIQQINGVRR